jgi:glycosyltransferase involved in cell wall biosynthesis
MFASVVIPTRNAVHRLLYTLTSLNFQYTPFEEFEVIVVDNASTDGLREKIKAFAAHFPLQYCRVSNPVTARQVLNAGIVRARGDVLILLGENMIVPRHFVGTHLQAHARRRRLILTGGPTKRVYSVYYPTFSRRQHEECHKWLEQYPQIKRPHTTAEIVPLLTEQQIATDLLTAIGLPGEDEEKREEVLRRYGHRLDRYHHPWTLFRTDHVSMERSACMDVGMFHKGPSSLRQLESDMGRRLRKAGYSFEMVDKLILLEQVSPRPSAIARYGTGHSGR